MATPQTANSHERLDNGSISTMLGSVNTELKCLSIGPLTTDAALNQQSVHEAAIGEVGSSLLRTKLQAPVIGKLLARMPEDIVITEGEKGDRKFRLAEPYGVVASGLAGQMLTLSVESALPTRKLVGEAFTLKDGNKDDWLHPIETRLIILTSLLMNARDAWADSKDILTACEPLGLGKFKALHQLATLRGHRMVEQRVKPRHRAPGLRPNQYRIDTTRAPFSTAELIDRYLKIVGKLAVQDADLITEGHEALTKIRHNKKIVPYLVKRSFASSNHFGKTVQRKNKKA